MKQICSKIQLSKEINRVNTIERSTLLKKRDKSQEDKLILVLTYHPAVIKVVEIVRKLHKHVVKSLRLNAVLPTPPRIAFRNPKTLKDMLVRSKLKTETSLLQLGTMRCNSSCCEICPQLILGDSFTSTLTGKSYKINFPLECSSTNVI